MRPNINRPNHDLVFLERIPGDAVSGNGNEIVLARLFGTRETHIYASGRLGNIQPIGAEPGKYKPSSSYVCGVGAFLMAGSELSQITGSAIPSGHNSAMSGRLH